MAVIGGKWKPLILFHLGHDARRNGNLRPAIGNVSGKMLIQQLKELEADGIVDRFDFKEIRLTYIPECFRVCQKHKVS
ncbi:winged helix-turn-helix transcriptional regulator [Novacetimonas pomaceti]|uniref:winged helix-turn-helix transcriptional regulator n=1 Tax=Novacetimonas pomaceti TaxID=2021998 RepID=UPI001EF09511|nr:winged helix-turn-helix transcriptional regulator [Novacetimonas pomaceti]